MTGIVQPPNNAERWLRVLTSLQKHYEWRDGGKQAVSAMEDRLGITLPSDLRFFYSSCDGVRLFRSFDAPFTILPSAEVDYIHVMYAEEAGNEDLLAICYCQDSDYIGVRLFPEEDRYEIVDCWHEDFPDFSEAQMISRSLLDFLEDLLNSEGLKFWLGRPLQE